MNLKLICHQKLERCFKLFGKKMFICSRCFGVYISLILVLLGLFLYGFSFPKRIVLLLFVSLNIPLVIDGVSQYFGLRKSNNFLRFATGILAGSGAAFAIYYLLGL